MKYLLIAILPIGLVGCGSQESNQSLTPESKTGQSGKEYREIGLEGVYMVDTTAARTVIDNYIGSSQYQLVAEILSDKPLVIGIDDIPAEESARRSYWYPTSREPSTQSYQYFITLESRASDPGIGYDLNSGIDWELTVTEYTSENITLGEALKMKPNERISGRASGTTLQGTAKIPKPPGDILPLNDNYQYARTNGWHSADIKLKKKEECVSIFRRVASLDALKDGRIESVREWDICSLDIWGNRDAFQRYMQYKPLSERELREALKDYSLGETDE